MAEETSTKRGRWGRKEVLAAVLLLVMCALTGRMVYFFWQEGDSLCRALQAELAHLPSAKMPCTKTTYPIGAIDWARAQATGAGFAQRTVRHQFDDDGDLLRVESDHDGDGAADITYRCSTFAKIVMPITNYAAWSSYSTFEEMAKGSAPVPKRVADDHGQGVSGLQTELTVIGDPRFESALLVNASTRDEDGRLLRRVRQGMVPGRLTNIDYAYDERGNLSSKRHMSVNHPYTLSRQTDYTYECWD